MSANTNCIYSSGPLAFFSHDDVWMSKYFDLAVSMEHRTHHVAKSGSKICVSSTLLTQGIDVKLALNA